MGSHGYIIRCHAGARDGERPGGRPARTVPLGTWHARARARARAMLGTPGSAHALR